MMLCSTQGPEVDRRSFAMRPRVAFLIFGFGSGFGLGFGLSFIWALVWALVSVEPEALGTELVCAF